MSKLRNWFFPHDHKPYHVKALDGLRGVAVLLVVLSHCSNEGILFHEYLNFAKVGKVGVYLFFVLSAYLLDRQIALALIHGKAGIRYWINYTIRRFLRIYPMYLLALFAFFLTSTLLFETVIQSWRDVATHVLLSRGKAIFWSIPVEFKYYLISPLILVVCHSLLKWKRNQVYILILSVIVASIIINEFTRLPNTNTFRFISIFLAGTLVSIYETVYPNTIKISKKIVEFGALMAFVLILLTVPYYNELVLGKEINFQVRAYYFPYALLWCLILISLRSGIGVVKKVFEFKPLRFIGTISFSVYLFHLLFLHLIVEEILVVDPSFKIYVFFATALIFSSLTYLFIERPLSKINLTYLESKLSRKRR